MRENRARADPTSPLSVLYSPLDQDLANLCVPSPSWGQICHSVPLLKCHLVLCNPSLGVSPSRPP